MAIKVIYLHNLLANMGFSKEPNTLVFDENTACIELGNHVSGGRERAKHIDIFLCKHSTHEVIQNQEMQLVEIVTTSLLADLYQQILECHRGILLTQVPVN